MNDSTIKSSKVELTDFNYSRDIQNRLLMAKLNAVEVEVLKEILDNSLKFNISHLSESLNISISTLQPILAKFAEVQLLDISGSSVTVNKELRKYYEAQISKFDEDFEPGLEFLQGLLNKIPIHVLPNWYSISRTSDRIFHSIVEKYLQTPKIFENYLKELKFDYPELPLILRDVFRAPDFKLSSQFLMDKYKLSHEHFEKCMLILEFSLACCISYEMIDGKWEEIVTPFYEWQEYLKFVRDTFPQTIQDSSAILRVHSEDFCFVKDMIALLAVMQKTPISVHSHESDEYSLSTETAKKLLPKLASTSISEQYTRSLIDKLIQLKLASVSNNSLHIGRSADNWLKLPIQDQSHSIYRLQASPNSVIHTFSEKDIREVEKNLRRVAFSGWISFDSFFESMTIAIGDVEAVTLTNKGKRWKYTIPNYTDKEREFVKALICEKFFESGMVFIGFQGDQLCFSVTALGRMSLGE